MYVVIGEQDNGPSTVIGCFVYKDQIIGIAKRFKKNKTYTTLTGDNISFDRLRCEEFIDNKLYVNI